jgi:folylpolyglutamate synthase/dihydropteroate synthase
VEEATGRRPRVFRDVPTALESLVESSADGLVVTGSLTTAGQARAWVSSAGLS